MSASREYKIARYDQLRALATPARQEIIDVILASGRGSVGDIATALGRAADSLYYHIRILKKVGLLVEVETRRRGRRDEIVFDVPGRPMKIEYDLASRKFSVGVVNAVGAMLRISRRDFGEAVAGGTADVEGPYRSLWGARVKAWMSKAQLKNVNRHLQELCKIYSSSKRKPGSRLHSLTFVITPVEPNMRDEKNRCIGERTGKHRSRRRAEGDELK